MTRYSIVAIALHWTIAALVAINLAIGLTFRTYDPVLRSALMAAHRTVGLTVLMLMLCRIFWRAVQPPPRFAAPLRAWEKAAARLVHLLLYALMLAIPLAGWIIASSWSPPHRLAWWGLAFPLIPLPPLSEAGLHVVHNRAATLHLWLSLVLIGLIAIHSGGAIKHQWIDRDGVLARMIPLRWLRAKARDGV